MLLTDLEKQVLKAVIFSDYNDHEAPVDYPVWYIEASDYGIEMKPQQLSGAISSCVKKGYVGINKDGNESTIWITQLGFDTYNK